MSSDFETIYRITSAQTDSLYGHVHHAEVVRILELARSQMLDRAGIPLSIFLDRGEFIVVTKLDVSFRRELMQGEVRLRCHNTSIISRKIILEQQILELDGGLLVSAEVHLMFMSKQTRRAMQPPQEFRERFLA